MRQDLVARLERLPPAQRECDAATRAKLVQRLQAEQHADTSDIIDALDALQQHAEELRRVEVADAQRQLETSHHEASAATRTVTFLIWQATPSSYGRRHLPRMAGNTFLVWQAAPSSYGRQHLPRMAGNACVEATLSRPSLAGACSGGGGWRGGGGGRALAPAAGRGGGGDGARIEDEGAAASPERARTARRRP